MKKVVIIPNLNKDNDFEVTNRVISKLQENGIVAYIKENYNIDGTYAVGYKEFPTDAELIIVVGGDGSVIDASKYAVEFDIPILGINLGKVGYLAELDVENLNQLDLLASEDFVISEKMLLESEKIGEGEFSRLAVNDVVVSHDSYLGIADMKIEDSMGNCVKYRADGIILATPQGSTAYSLSGGGPVVAHDVESIVMTPVCPHSFFNRSVLFNSNDEISITNTGETELNISIDGRCVGSLSACQTCKIRKSKIKIKMLTFSKNSMFSNLFKKMRLLEDID